MKTYIKPNTNLHKIELQLMNPATTPQITGDTAGKDAITGDYDDAKINSFSSSNSLWDEEE